MNAAWWWPSDCDRHVQGSQGEILLHAISDRPTNDTARKQINDYSRIDPPFTCPDISDVPGPFLAGAARRKVLPQEIRCDVKGVVALCGALELAAADDLDAILAHKSPDTALSDTKAQLIQLLGHAWPAVAAQAQPVLVADMGEEHHVAPLAMRRRAMLPGMKSAF